MKDWIFLTNIFAEFGKFFDVMTDSRSSKRLYFQYYLSLLVFKHLKIKKELLCSNTRVCSNFKNIFVLIKGRL